MTEGVLKVVLLKLFLTTVNAGDPPPNSTLKIEYRKPHADLYREVVISDAEGVVRILSGDPASGGGIRA